MPLPPWHPMRVPMSIFVVELAAWAVKWNQSEWDTMNREKTHHVRCESRKKPSFPSYIRDAKAITLSYLRISCDWHRTVWFFSLYTRVQILLLTGALTLSSLTSDLVASSFVDHSAWTSRTCTNTRDTIQHKWDRVEYNYYAALRTIRAIRCARRICPFAVEKNRNVCRARLWSYDVGPYRYRGYGSDRRPQLHTDAVGAWTVRHDSRLKSPNVEFRNAFWFLLPLSPSPSYPEWRLRRTDVIWSDGPRQRRVRNRILWAPNASAWVLLYTL